MRGTKKTSIYIPNLDELWFREELMSDPDTMSYNNAWGGTIPFPKEDWEDWYNNWVLADDGKHFYGLAETVHVIWTAETKWNQIVTENLNKNV